MSKQSELDRWCVAFLDGDMSAGQFKRAITDWHNKQMSELLDRLEARKEQTIYADFESGSVEGWTGVPVTTIEAERNKLEVEL